MGSRAQVKVEPDNVYLYTHWGANEIVETVKTALKKRWRWDDPEYLTRIIFDTMTDGKQGGETGFGIGSVEHDDNETPLITVNADNQTVTINGKTQHFEDFIS